jgi:DNA-directed RNA polymerase specialized sigma24 family protein/ribosome-associated translation inhibitor RaiA
MQIHWTFRHCDSGKEEARNYLARSIPRLERRISRFGTDRCRLELTLYHHSGRHRWELRAVLKLPTGSLVTVEELSELDQVIDRVIDELTRQLRRHKSRVRKEHVLRRRQHRGRELVTALPYLERDISQDRREEFFTLLSPRIESVREHAQYELQALEEEGAIAVGELVVEELVDEVLLLAFDRFRLRPPDSLMEAWLMELLHERLTALAPHELPVSMLESDENAGEPADEGDQLGADDVNYWMTFLFEPEEEVRLEELVPDQEPLAAVSQPGSADQRRELRRLLARLPKRARQALMLHEASGFEIPEIAAMLRMDEGEVESLIEHARTSLRKNLAGRSKHESAPEA